ncbi:MAG TPA: beta-ketoacyl-[acyl-carrier-protein] synthase family protein [Symbiobacteriaceae bacterium]|nr:beta-ketoacyl-[acyl-carrier-protein] synthase family protein [Symbiobacteriaceae bacterium]
MITGIGVVAANGLDAESFCHTLQTGRSGIGPISAFDVTGYRAAVAGQVDLPVGAEVDRTILLAEGALDQALADAGWTAAAIASVGSRAGFAFATSRGGASRVMAHVQAELADREPDPDWLFDLHGCAAHLAAKAGVAGPCLTNVSACAAGTGVGGIALDMIRWGRADLVVMGGSEALIELCVGGFHAMKALSPSGRMKPFDQRREGLVLGEGAAFLVVERLEHAVARGARIYAEILGYGISNDAYHATSPDPEGGGAVRAMRMALQDAGVEPQAIDYLNAHGTSTLVNDTMELRAIGQVFGEHAAQMAISSTKSITGHCLGASGSLEMVVSVLALTRSFCPPTAGLVEPEQGHGHINLVMNQAAQAELGVVMSNSFAFGGNVASIILKRYEGEGVGTCNTTAM